MPSPSPREILIDEVKTALGDGMVDVELDPKHYDYAVTVAFSRYRQRSTNAMEESFLFLDLQPSVSVYTMPDEVQEVRMVYRRTTGGAGGGGATIDPFSLAWANNLYMINNPGGMGGGSGTGMMATFDFAMQYQSLAGRMFGRDVMFTWDASTKRLVLQRNFTAVETVVIHVYNTRPEGVLVNDPYARPWLRDYAIAVAKQVLGEARGKYGNLAGPQGGITLNGETLKTEAKEMMERLDNELKLMVDSHIGMPFVIG